MSRRRSTAPPVPKAVPASGWRSSRQSFPYFLSGGVAYFAGVLLVLAGVVGPIAGDLEIGLLVAGSVLVVLGFVIDRHAGPAGPDPADRSG